MRELDKDIMKMLNEFDEELKAAGIDIDEEIEDEQDLQEKWFW